MVSPRHRSELAGRILACSSKTYATVNTSPDPRSADVVAHALSEPGVEVLHSRLAQPLQAERSIYCVAHRLRRGGIGEVGDSILKCMVSCLSPGAGRLADDAPE